MMVVREMKAFDTLDFCNTLNIDKATFKQLEADMKDPRKNPGYSSYTPQLFMSQLDVEEYGLLQEKLYKFPGIYIQNRTERQYKYPYMGLILGYVAEVDKNKMAADPYYVRGDYVGKSGVELSHEEDLRGEKGVEVLLRDAHGRVQGKYRDGEFDKMPVSGRDLTLSIDVNLQAYGEYLMQNKIGSIIMIEPKTGEILCMVAAPSYDPSILTGKNFSQNYLKLERDPYKPLINRAISGLYPPGSTFKPSQGLVFLQEGIITADTRYSCFGGYPPLGGRPACHGHASPLNLQPALATSCNSFFCYGLNAMLNDRTKYGSTIEAFEVWKEHMVDLFWLQDRCRSAIGEEGLYSKQQILFNRVQDRQVGGAQHHLHCHRSGRDTGYSPSACQLYGHHSQSGVLLQATRGKSTERCTPGHALQQEEGVEHPPRTF